MAIQRRMGSKFRKRRQVFLALVIALSILLVCGIGYVVYQRTYANTRDYTGNGNGHSVLIRVDPGESMSGLAPSLLDNKVIASSQPYIDAANNNPQHTELQPGYYALEEHMSSQSTVKALLNDDNRRGVVDIPNGSTLEDVKVVNGSTRPGIYSMVSKQTCKSSSDDSECITPKELEKVAASANVDDLGIPNWAKKEVSARGNDSKRIEGLIAPGVHLFDPTSSPKDILHELLTASADHYEDTGIISASSKLDLSPYEMLVAASLVEREAPEGDFDKVARVILNRLGNDQKLEFDSTVNYSLGEQEVATTPEDRSKQTPWNTYAKEGLPDTPIASPGENALTAMENPAQGDWLYFVTVDQDGTTVFNDNFDDHQAAAGDASDNGVLDSSREQ